MTRRGKVPVVLMAMVLGVLFYGPNPGRISAHLGFGDSPFLTTVVEPVSVAATPGVLYVTRPLCGKTKQLLKFEPSSFPAFQQIDLPLHGSPDDCFEDAVAIAGPKDPARGGFPSPTKAAPIPYLTNFVYVSQGQSIIEIDLTGAITKNPYVKIPACGSDRTGITFDHSGTFGYNLIVTCVNGKVYKVTRNSAGNGVATLVADVANALGLASVKIENPDVSPLTSPVFPGHILVAATSHDRVLAISASGVVTRIGVRWRSAEGVNVIPAVKCGWGASTATYFTVLFSPGAGTIHQFARSDFSGLSGKALVTSESKAGIGLLEPVGPGFRIRAFHNVGTHHEGSAFVNCDVPTLVNVLARLGTPEGINPDKQNITTFTVLSTLAFDASNLETVIQTDSNRDGIQDVLTFGFTGNEFSVHFPCKVFDVNRDGRKDLLCDADVKRLNIPSSALDSNGRYMGPLIVKGKGVPGGDDFEGSN